MIFDMNDVSPSATYHLMTQSIIPRPIAWVLSKNEDSMSYNLAPFSYFNAISSDPPLLLFSCGPKSDGSLKDTIINCQREEQLVIHIANYSQLQAVQDTAQELQYGESELELAHMSLTNFGDTGLQRLTEAPIAFACTLHQTQTIGNAPQTLIFAEIKNMYINDNVLSLNNNRIAINAQEVTPLARLGLNQFCKIGETLMPQPKQSALTRVTN